MTDLNRDEAKKNHNHNHNHNQNGRLKKTEIFNSRFSIFFRENFRNCALSIGRVENLSLFLSRPFWLFLCHPYSNQSQFMGYQGWDKILMYILISVYVLKYEKHFTYLFTSISTIWLTLWDFRLDLDTANPETRVIRIASFGNVPFCSISLS